MEYRKKLTGLIIAGILLRCIIASFIELGNDEVYYWTYSQHLQWNYFDHPPLVAILIRLTTVNLSFQQFELFVRLGSITGCAFSTFFIFKTVALVHSQRAGFLAALLYNASLYGSVIAGVFILPDAAQMIFWTASLFLLAKIVQSPRPDLKQFILFGITAGLAMMSKIHAIFIWQGLLLYLLFYKRQWLRLIHFYAGAAISLLIALPLLWWNVANDFIMYRYHEGRVSSFSTLKTDNFLREIAGEILYNNPLNFIITLLALVLFFKQKKNLKNPFLLLSVFIALPMIFVFLTLSLFNDTLPHWSGPAYVTLIPLAAVYIATKKSLSVPVLARWPAIFILTIAIAGVVLVNFYPGTPGKKNSINEWGDGDGTLDMYGWKQAAGPIDSLVKDDQQKGIMDPQSAFVCNKWFPAAHIDYYIARPLNKKVIGLGNLYDLHHYEWLNGYRLQQQALHDAYCIVPSNYSCNVREVYGNRFATIDSVMAFPVYRSGKASRYFFVYRMKGFKGEAPQIR